MPCVAMRASRGIRELAMWHRKDYDKKLSENRPGQKA